MQGSHRSIRTTVAAATCAFIATLSIGMSHAADVAGSDTDAIEYTQKLQRVTDDKASVAAETVLRWENDARASGRWDVNYAQDLFGALMKLQPANLVAASQATTYKGMMSVLMTGRDTQAASAKAVTAKSLGDVGSDTVYTPVTPCRIVDTRNTGAFLAINVVRTFDVDGTTFTGQGGVNTSCGIPFGVASAVVMSVAVTGADNAGFFRAWGLNTEPATGSFLNFVAGQTLAVTTIVPVVGGSGNDFSLVSRGANAHAIIDVMGYFSAPESTALECTNVASAVAAIPNNSYTAVDAICTTGYSVTGGGTFPIEGTLGRPAIWTDGSPTVFNGWRTWVDNQSGATRSLQTYARCCRVPGR